MADADVKRRLAAILAADVAGYSRLMGDDERATIATLREYRDVFRARIEANGGRVVDMAGDSVLSVFDSASGAVQAATETQGDLASRNEGLPEERRMLFRIGVNLGDIEEAEDGTVYGDGVNVAARLEAMANPGGINVSGSVFDSVRSKLGLPFAYLGEHDVKNIADPVRAYSLGGGRAARRGTPKRAWWAAGAVAAALLVAVGAWQMWPKAPVQVAPLVVATVDPVIAVIPFENLSGEPEQDYFATGLTDTMIERLGRFSQYAVISRSSTMQFSGATVDPRQIAEDLGVRYIVYGSVQKLDKTIRLSVRVVSGDTGEQLWAETYEGDLTASSLFQIQDEITEKAVGVIADYRGVIGQAERDTVRNDTPTESLEAYECTLRAMVFWDGPTPDLHAAVRDCLESAVKVEPTYADAWAFLSEMYWVEHQFRFNVLPDSLDRSLDAAQKAFEADPNYWFTPYVVAEAHFYRHEVDSFFAWAERALAMNVGNATALASLGGKMLQAGRVDEGLSLVLKGAKLNPRYPSWYNYYISGGHYMRGEYEESLTSALRLDWGINWDYVYRAVAYAQLGRISEARNEIEALEKIDPEFGDEVWQRFRIFNFPDDRIRQYLEGLRKAGLDVSDEPPLTH